jgi:hypothetical protein
MSRIDQFVAAMVSGWLPPTDRDFSLLNGGVDKDALAKTIEEKCQAVVAMAIRLDQLIADHELKQFTSPPLPIAKCPTVSDGLHRTLKSDPHHCINCGVYLP